MGMFDYVRANHDSFGKRKGEQFQTKDTDEQYLHQYTINEQGRLIADEVRYEDQSDRSAPKGSFESLHGCMTPVKIGDKDENFHGYLYMGAPDCSVRCKFTDGTLVDVEITEADPVELP
jgi:hypothetical protein